MTNFHQRRQLLAVLAVGLAVPARQAPAQADFWSLPRRLWLHRPASRETAVVEYWRDGALLDQGYRLACHLLRDVRAKRTINIAPLLLDVLCGVQAWLQAYGWQRPLIIHSAYRTPAVNFQTEGAARNSLHMRGAAVDLSLPGVSSADLARLGLYLQGGGVGWYPAKNFVHLDVGAIRSWRG